jgi:F-type H+-transporting ATPase subunit b
VTPAKLANAFAFIAALALPALARAAGGGDEEAGESRLWEWVNLVLLIGALVYFARKPIANYLAGRRTGIESDLQNAEQLLRDAEGRLAEWNARAARLESEVADIKRSAREAAEQEGARIVADARASAERIRRDAASAVEREGARARARLRNETAELAVAAAESILKEQVQAADTDRLFDEFLTKIEQAPAAGARR